jgi:two-component system response regulator NreC
MMIRLILVDDHEVVRSGLRMLLANEEDIEILAETGSAAEAISAVEQYDPMVVLMDIGLPDMSGIEATRAIKEKKPETAIVALTIHEDEEYFFRMLEAGASGYVPKRAAPEELLTAIRTAAHGEVYLYPSLAKLLVNDYLSPDGHGRQIGALNGLTRREQEVLTHLAEGGSNADIGESLSISPKTVARHRENIMRKLNLHSRTELVRYAIRKGIIVP